ncbi:MAG: hypothetical protein AAF713_21410 [Pseudomonadota bacterium]
MLRPTLLLGSVSHAKRYADAAIAHYQNPFAKQKRNPTEAFETSKA